MPRKPPQIQYAGVSGAGYDQCQTPVYAWDALRKYLKRRWKIWESAVGQGNLAYALRANGYQVMGTDYLTGQDFFEFRPDFPYDVNVTNPPFSLKYRWLKRAYQIGKPFAFILPLATLGAVQAQILFKKYGMGLILLDQRVNFRMPEKGYLGNGAQFPVAWFTWKLGLDGQTRYEKIFYRMDEYPVLKDWVKYSETQPWKWDGFSHTWHVKFILGQFWEKVYGNTGCKI